MGIGEIVGRRLAAPGLKASARRGVAHASKQLAPEVDRLARGLSRSAIADVAELDAPLRQRAPDLLRLKYERMAADPFGFFRGSDGLFYRDLARTEGDAATRGPRTVLNGDLHLGNFGTMVQRDGHVSYTLNDFDEAFTGPAMLDLKRMAASLAVLGDQRGFSRHQTSQLITKFSEGYHDGLLSLEKHPHHPKKAIPPKPDAIRSLLEDSRSRDEEKWLAKLAPEGSGGRRFARTELVTDVSPAQAKAAKEAFGRFRTDLPSEQAHQLAAFEVKDVAAVAAGTGSLGRSRFRLLLEAPGQQAQVFEMKEEIPSAVAQIMGGKNPFGTEARRNLTVSEAMDGPLDALRGEVRAPRLGAASDSFVVSRRVASKDTLEVDELSAGDLEDVMAYYGAKVAVGHAGGASLGLASTAQLLAALPGKKDLAAELDRFARQYAPQVRRDHAAFKAALAQDPLLAKFAP